MTDDDEEEFDALLAAYLEPPSRERNPQFVDIEIDISDAVAEKLWRKHGIAREDIEDAIKGSPPPVEEMSHDDPECRQFYGFTRHGHGLFVVGVWNGRRLRVITGFLPDDDEDYWKRQRG
jgi:hypothetical protein